MSENAFKNWINPAVVKKTATVFQKVYPSFNTKRFQKISAQLDDLELKQRVLLLTEGLKSELPEDFSAAVNILQQVLNEKSLKGFELWPLSEYVSQFGLGHVDESLELMYHLTQQFTSEFAIRPFLQRHPELVLEKLSLWLNDENAHVRRWISEGTRPLLPWGGKIHSFIQKPATVHLLDALKFDEELYVRRSVANHLNDMTKHHPELVIETLKQWAKVTPEHHREKIHWIKKHALRTLIKKGHTKSLSLMGVSTKTAVKISGFGLNKEKFRLGEVLEFQFVLESQGRKVQNVIIDYGIGFVKSNGSITTKMFKLKALELEAKKKVLIKKKHSLKRITTMTFYPGVHELRIQVNGKVMKKVSWTFHP